MTARIRQVPPPPPPGDGPHPGIECSDAAYEPLAPPVPHWWAPDPPDRWPWFWARTNHQQDHTEFERKTREQPDTG